MYQDKWSEMFRLFRWPLVKFSEEPFILVVSLQGIRGYTLFCSDVRMCDVTNLIEPTFDMKISHYCNSS